MIFPVIKSVSNMLFHVPSMARHGSKPLRELGANASVLPEFLAHLRSFDQALAYPPNQVFIGNMSPDDLGGISRPWFKQPMVNAHSEGTLGEILSEATFNALLKVADEANLLLLENNFVESVRDDFAKRALVRERDVEKLGRGVSRDELKQHIESEQAVPLFVNGDQLIGCMQRGHESDEALTAQVLLENLACKASGMWALRAALAQPGAVKADEIDYVLGCGEEAVGDRYQRGGGSMGKIFGEGAGCLQATGADLKAFCCGPVHALIVGASLVHAGVCRNVAVVGGGSLAKLGMKFQRHLSVGMPILEDVLGAIAIIIGAADGLNPQVRLDAVGRHAIGMPSRPQTIADVLVNQPLAKLKRRIIDIDKYATELHDPDITEPAGSGNVPRNNYRIIGSLAALAGEIGKQDLDEFVRVHGLPGFSPTQGHIASAIPFLGIARIRMLAGQMNSSLFMAKGSLFLGRMTQLSDGVSFILERSGQ